MSRVRSTDVPEYRVRLDLPIVPGWGSCPPSNTLTSSFTLAFSGAQNTFGASTCRFQTLPSGVSLSCRSRNRIGSPPHRIEPSKREARFGAHKNRHQSRRVHEVESTGKAPCSVYSKGWPQELELFNSKQHFLSGKIPKAKPRQLWERRRILLQMSHKAHNVTSLKATVVQPKV